jgi:hypothetical protein
MREAMARFADTQVSEQEEEEEEEKVQAKENTDGLQRS